MARVRGLKPEQIKNGMNTLGSVLEDYKIGYVEEIAKNEKIDVDKIIELKGGMWDYSMRELYSPEQKIQMKKERDYFQETINHNAEQHVASWLSVRRKNRKLKKKIKELEKTNEEIMDNMEEKSAKLERTNVGLKDEMELMKKTIGMYADFVDELKRISFIDEWKPTHLHRHLVGLNERITPLEIKEEELVEENEELKKKNAELVEKNKKLVLELDQHYYMGHQLDEKVDSFTMVEKKSKTLPQLDGGGDDEYSDDSDATCSEPSNYTIDNPEQIKNGRILTQEQITKYHQAEEGCGAIYDGDRLIGWKFSDDDDSDDSDSDNPEETKRFKAGENYWTYHLEKNAHLIRDEDAPICKDKRCKRRSSRITADHAYGGFASGSDATARKRLLEGIWFWDYCNRCYDAAWYNDDRALPPHLENFDDLEWDDSDYDETLDENHPSYNKKKAENIAFLRTIEY